MSKDQLMEKLLDVKKIKKLDIDLFDERMQKSYEEYKEFFIKDKIKTEGLSAKQAEDLFNVEYPDIYEYAAAGKGLFLNAVGEQRLVNKVNEIIDVVNKLQGAE